MIKYMEFKVSVAAIIVIVGAFISALAIGLTGCTTNSNPNANMTNEQVNTSLIGTDNGKTVCSHEYWYFVDPDTGVQYICWKHGYAGGMTPRLNADGTIMVEET